MLCNGKTLAFQARDTGSIPVTRSTSVKISNTFQHFVRECVPRPIAPWDTLPVHGLQRAHCIAGESPTFDTFGVDFRSARLSVTMNGHDLVL